MYNERTGQYEKKAGKKRQGQTAKAYPQELDISGGVIGAGIGVLFYF